MRRGSFGQEDVLSCVITQPGKSEPDWRYASYFLMEPDFSGGYVPSREGWCVSPVRGFEHGTWVDVAPGPEPRPGEREPWAQAHVEGARRFLDVLRGGPRDGLATLEECATVQEVLAAARVSEEPGRRVHLA